jgi:chitin disaccharide deacetylase
LIICADDFGIAPDVDDAILDLAQRGRISAVSCMMTAASGPCCIQKHLPALAGKVDLGLHLNLVEGRPLSTAQEVPSLLESSGGFAGFRALLMRSLPGRIQPTHLQAEIAAQYGRFVKIAGRPPDFIDSHMHVHQLQGISKVLTCFLREQGSRFYVRNSHQSFRQIVRRGISPVKSLAISVPGLRFKRLLLSQGMPTNTEFAGVYQFDQCDRYPLFLSRFLRDLQSPNGILMTHPGKSERWRRAEYEALLAAPPELLRANRFRFS